jgi:hypothetical protein
MLIFLFCVADLNEAPRIAYHVAGEGGVVAAVALHDVEEAGVVEQQLRR